MITWVVSGDGVWPEGDPRNLRGRWLTAAFQHNRLHAVGSEADRTVVYLISDRPFAASLR